MARAYAVVRFSEADEIVPCKGCAARLLLWGPPLCRAIHEGAECGWFTSFVHAEGNDPGLTLVDLVEDV